MSTIHAYYICVLYIAFSFIFCDNNSAEICKKKKASSRDFLISSFAKLMPRKLPP